MHAKHDTLEPKEEDPQATAPTAVAVVNAIRNAVTYISAAAFAMTTHTRRGSRTRQRNLILMTSISVRTNAQRNIRTYVLTTYVGITYTALLAERGRVCFGFGPGFGLEDRCHACTGFGLEEGWHARNGLSPEELTSVGSRLHKGAL